MIKLKALLPEWISHGNAVNMSPDSQMRPVPGGWNDNSPNWDGITEGKEWFCYVEGNDWHNHLAEATIYINEEGQPPHKIWIKIKTHGLRKPHDTNKSHKERVRKHTESIVRKWMSESRRQHKNIELNEIGNPIPKTWKETFKNSIEVVKPFISECGET